MKETEDKRQTNKVINKKDKLAAQRIKKITRWKKEDIEKEYSEELRGTDIIIRGREKRRRTLC